MQTPERVASVSWIQTMQDGLQQVADQGIAELTNAQKRIQPEEWRAYERLSNTPPILLAIRSSEDERSELAVRAAAVFCAIGSPLAFEQLMTNIQNRVDGAWESGDDCMIPLGDANILTSDEHQSIFHSYPGGVEQVVRETIQRAQDVLLSCLSRPELPLLPNLRRDMVRERPGVTIKKFKGRMSVKMPTSIEDLMVLYEFRQNDMFPKTWLSVRIPEEAFQTLMPSKVEIGLFLARMFHNEDTVLSQIQAWRDREGKSNEETETAMYLDAALKTYVFARKPFDIASENKTPHEQLEMFNMLNAATKKTANLWLEKDRTSRAGRSIAKHGFWAPAEMHQAFLMEMWPEIAQSLELPPHSRAHSGDYPTSR